MKLALPHVGSVAHRHILDLLEDASHKFIVVF